MANIEKYLSGKASWSDASEEELRLGYEAMAADEEAEREALEWCEALIGDSYEAATRD